MAFLRVHFVSGLLLLAGLCSCNGHQEMQKRRLFLVLCDVSNSITYHHVKNSPGVSGNLEELKGYVRAIPDKIDAPASVFYIPVSSNMNEKPAPEEGIRLLAEGNDAVLGQQKEENDRGVAAIVKTLDSLSLVRPSSCILSSIEHCYDVFREKRLDGGADSLELIIVSDMLETCRESPVGPYTLDLQDPASIRRVEDEYHPRINFGSLPIRIVIVNASPMTNERDKNRLQDVWNVLFRKMGYGKGVLLRTTLPERL